MSSLIQKKVKFLRDENVPLRLETFLKQQGFDIISKPKRLSNGKLAEFSKQEERVLITNDSHFTDSFVFPAEEIFSIIWLRISQDQPESLLNSFSELIKSKAGNEDFEGKLFILKEEKFEEFPIGKFNSL